MNNDIRPPKRPESTFVPPRHPRQPDFTSARPIEAETKPSIEDSVALPTSSQDEGIESGVPGVDALPAVQKTTTTDVESAQMTPTEALKTSGEGKTNTKRKRLMIGGILLGLALVLLAIIAGFVWYQQQLAPMTDKNSAVTEQVKVENGSTPNQIAGLLKQKGLIRSELGFLAYTRLQGVRGQLQAGSYMISTGESMKEIVGHLTSGRVEEYEITFYPGAALSSSAPTDSTLTHKQVLEKAGFDSAEIDAAFTAAYDHPLLASKPTSADLEGYIYGDTYRIAAGSTVEEILRKTFDEFYAKLEEKDVLTTLEQKNMSLYEAITLASIVQRESGGDDKAQIAQVFFSRLEKGMNLGSDVTYQYAADKMGVPRDVNLDSPYNTRRFGGLPPGPIASPGIAAMEAVARPAEGDYLYFLSGDDDITYYARTVEEHEKNIADHCKQKCSIL